MGTIKMSLSVYLKNISSNVLKTHTQVIGQIRDANSPQLLQVIALLCDLSKEIANGLISPQMEWKFKYNCSMVLMRFFNMIQQVSIACPELFDNLMQNVAELVQHSLSETGSANQMIGTIQLCECVINTLDSNRLDSAFEALNGRLKFIADQQLTNFRQSQAELIALMQ